MKLGEKKRPLLGATCIVASLLVFAATAFVGPNPLGAIAGIVGVWVGALLVWYAVDALVPVQTPEARYSYTAPPPPMRIYEGWGGTCGFGPEHRRLVYIGPTTKRYNDWP